MGQVPGVDAEEIAHARTLQPEKSRDAVRGRIVHPALHDGAENPEQHVVEMDPDVGRHAAASGGVALPRGGIPPAARRDVGQFDVVDAVRRSLRHGLLQPHDFGMEAQLQYGPHVAAAAAFRLDHPVDLPGRETQGFLADHVRARGEPRQRVGQVHVVGSADREVIGGAVAQLPFERTPVRGEVRPGEVAVHDPHAVGKVVRRRQLVTECMDGAQVARCDVAGYACDREFFSAVTVLHRSVCCSGGSPAIRSFAFSEYKNMKNRDICCAAIRKIPPRPDKRMIDRMLYFSDGTVLFVFADAFLRPAAGREAERRRSAR